MEAMTDTLAGLNVTDLEANSEPTEATAVWKEARIEDMNMEVIGPLENQ
jgi:hypothetical protein